MSVSLPLGRAEIEQILPHREPFLLIDEVLELTPGVGAVARKAVREDEWYLSGHFPGRPVMPGVLIVEALAQTGAVEAAAYDLLAGCTGFMYALAQAYGTISAGLAERALVVGGDVLSRILDWTDRSTLVLFGDGAGAVVLERVPEPGFLGFELGADGGGGIHLSLPGSGSRRIEDGSGNGFVHMNGREVFKFATRVLVSSAQAVLERCGVSVDEVDVYVPHQANVRIMDHAAEKLGIPKERMVVNVDRYGNNSYGSIPLALADAQRDGRLKKGDLVLMTGMGAGLTWGSGLMEWTL